MKQAHVIGVMSGTSLDGIDLAEIFFTDTENWNFKLGVCKTIPYSKFWVEKLKNAHLFSKKELEILNTDYTKYLALVIKNFISKENITEIDAICSHGHTILHQPESGFTLQIGNQPKLAQLTGQNIVCDFRVADVALGGEGAPLVPIGDQLLFSEYDYCINLGGFANISYQKNNKRIAYDICPVNVVLNHFAEKLGTPYDTNGNFAQGGNIQNELLEKLNTLEFYKQLPPKSLGIEWVNSEIFPLIDKFTISEKEVLRTFTEHIAYQISEAVKGISAERQKTILITGGGAYNGFLIERIKFYTTNKIEIPDAKIIEYKEALIFGLLGVLRLQNKTNVLSSVTGANKDHSSGNIFYYQKSI